MTVIKVLAFRNGEPLGEYVARSESMNEQQMVDYMFDRAKDGIGFKFLTDHGFIDPSILRRPSMLIL